MSKVYCYTITRASTPDRARLLNNTLTLGRNTADYEFHWHVHCNGSGSLGEHIVESAKAVGVIDSYTVSQDNEGQHPPANLAIKLALEEGYDYLLRVDDDVEWLSKRWLVRLIEASQALGDKLVLSPKVKGLRWLPPQSQTIEVEGVPIRIVEGPLGGICRLTPTSLLRLKPYVSDVRLAMGGGDAGGIEKWATRTKPIIPLAYCEHIRIRHAKTTNQQEKDDPKHFNDHALFQVMPYIPVLPCE